MACKLHRRIALRRKLQILRILAKSKSVKKRCIIMEAIYKLRLQVEAIKKEYQHLIDQIQEVKVENIGKDYLLVKVRCKKLGEEMLVSILEAFEEMNLEVVEARITCKLMFGMEAILKAEPDINVNILNQAILKLILQMQHS